MEAQSKAAELRGLGFTEEQAEAHVAHLRAQAHQSGTVELWEQHQPALEVFGRCQWLTQSLSTATGARIVWLGIGTAEIQAVTGVLGMACTPELLDDVQTMAAAGAAIRNKVK